MRSSLSTSLDHRDSESVRLLHEHEGQGGASLQEFYKSEYSLRPSALPLSRIQLPLHPPLLLRQLT